MKISILTATYNRANLLSKLYESIINNLNAKKNTDAPFIRVLEKIMEYEEEYQEQLYQLLRLQKQIDETIATVDEVDLRMVLTYRYIKSLSWYKIGAELCIDESTARRWHDKALTKVTLPEDAIEI